MTGILQADQLTDSAGTGAPDAPYGLTLGGGSPLLIYKPWQAWVPSFVGCGSPPVNDAYARQIGDTIEVCGTFTVGTPSGTPAGIVLPAGVTINRGKIPSGARNSILGIAQIMAAGNNVFASVGQTPMIWDDGASTDKVYFANTTSSGAFTPVNGSAIFSAGQIVNYRIFGLPVS